MTTEVALVATLLLGALAVDRPPLAAALGVAASIILAVRSPLRRFVRQVLTDKELADGLVFAALTFVVWPLLPDRPLGPFGVINPHAVWLVVILAMSIGACGHVAVRILGARMGLPLTGFASGFISSSVTIGAMGARAARDPAVLPAAAAGAVISTVATIVQLALLLAAVDLTVARAMAGPLLCAGLAALTYALAFTVRAAATAPEPDVDPGHAFNLTAILGFAAILCGVLVAAGALSHYFGPQGASAGAALAGFVDVHAAAVSVASLVASNREPVAIAVPAVLLALTTNTITKAIFALASGGRSFALRVTPGLIAVAAAGWLGALLPL